MIKGLLIINNHGQIRVSKFYERIPYNKQGEAIKDVYNLISKRNDNVCHFLDGTPSWGENNKIIYRNYATLYFVIIVDSSESELGIFDLIQVLVESLDRCFEPVRELDLIFHPDKVNFIIDEIIMGGMVLEINKEEIFRAIDDQNKLEKDSMKQGVKATIISR